ncbi:hypothetical protein [Streptomyces sp. NPDC002215]|uniref:hypothetical protein n=1 Tax=Streptomyces sp. NPDC002215 TaxID=3154412 RepID=UPI0033200F27
MLPRRCLPPAGQVSGAQLRFLAATFSSTSVRSRRLLAAVRTSSGCSLATCAKVVAERLPLGHGHMAFGGEKVSR